MYTYLAIAISHESYFVLLTFAHDATCNSTVYSIK